MIHNECDIACKIPTFTNNFQMRGVRSILSEIRCVFLQIAPEELDFDDFKAVLVLDDIHYFPFIYALP